MARADNIAKVKALLNIEDDKDALVAFALDNASDIIKSYCNIDEVPAELNTILIRIAMDLYRNEHLGSADTPQNVTSVSIGDTSTSFGDVSADFSQSIIKDYEKVLNRYRKVRFN